MDDLWLSCFGDSCTFVGSRQNGVPCNGRLVAGGAVIAVVRKGVVDFTEPPDQWESGLPELIENRQIPREWERWNGLKPAREDDLSRSLIFANRWRT